jgi:hypothetical protein
MCYSVAAACRIAVALLPTDIRAIEFAEEARRYNIEAFQTFSALFKEMGGFCGTYGKNRNANRF